MASLTVRPFEARASGLRSVIARRAVSVLAGAVLLLAGCAAPESAEVADAPPEAASALGPADAPAEAASALGPADAPAEAASIPRRVGAAAEADSGNAPAEVDSRAGHTTDQDARGETVAPQADVVLPEAVGERGGDPARGAGNPTETLRVALDWTTPGVGGGHISGQDYLGRDVILWFWAPWCAWCNVEAPRVAEAARQFDGQVEILGMPGVSDVVGLERFVDRHDLHHLDHAIDFDGSLWRRFDINYQPWWIFINDDGTVLENWQGRLSDEEIAERVDELIAS